MSAISSVVASGAEPRQIALWDSALIDCVALIWQQAQYNRQQPHTLNAAKFTVTTFAETGTKVFKYTGVTLLSVLILVRIVKRYQMD